VRRRRTRDKNALAILFQRHVRGFLARRNVVLAKRNAIVLQTHVRAALARVELERKRAAAIVIQAAERARKARKEFVQMKHAATTAQACVRRSQARAAFTELRGTALLVQTLLRTRSAVDKRKLVQREELVRAAVQGMMSRKRWNEKKKATITIQTQFRIFKARKDARRNLAAAKIQASVRSYFTRKLFLLQRSSAIRIQVQSLSLSFSLSSFSFLFFFPLPLSSSSFSFLFLFLLSLSSLSLLSTLITLNSLLTNFNSQAVTRGYLARASYARLGQAALTLQCAIRNYHALQELHTLSQQYRAATKIQACVKQHLARCVFLRMKRAATTIQAAFRRHRARSLFLHQRAAAIRVQVYLSPIHFHSLLSPSPSSSPSFWLILTLRPLLVAWLYAVHICAKSKLRLCFRVRCVFRLRAKLYAFYVCKGMQQPLCNHG
jgi:abnormal spindle-like microcephaly-associated protein